MSEEEFKVGDTVQPKNGGSEMVIIAKTKKGLFTCSWSDGEGIYQVDFDKHGLRKSR